MTQFLEKLLSKRGSLDPERIVVSFFSWGAIVLYAETSPRPQVLRAYRLELDANLTENERRNAFTAFLGSLGLKKLPSASLTWADGMIFRQLSMPDMPSEDLEKAFEWDLKKKFFYEPQDNHFGFMEVMTVQGQEGPEKLYDVFYCERKNAGAKLAFAQTLGFDIQSLVPAQAALSAFAGAIDPAAESDTLICERDGSTARIIVSHGDRPMLVRQLTLGIGEGDLTDEALGRIGDEIKKTLDFYEGQQYVRPVTKVVLAAFADAERIVPYMSKYLGTEVLVPQIEPYLSPEMPAPEKEIAMASSAYFASAIGAMMVREETMNLVPEDIKLLGKQRRASRSLNVALIGFAALLALVTGGAMIQVNMLKTELHALEKEYEKISAKRQSYETTLARERVRRAVIRGTVFAPSLLKEISYRIPAPLTLDEMRYSRPDQTLTLKGQVSDTKREGVKSVTQFATNLSESIFMQSASVANTNQDEQGIFRFEIAGNVKGLL